jgi:hypothetical protein
MFDHRSLGRARCSTVSRFHAWVLLTGLLFGFIVLPAHAGRILIDFGATSLPTPSPDALGRHWNSAGLPVGQPVTSTSFSPLPLVDETGAKLDWSLALTAPVLGAYDSGDNNQELYPGTAGKDRWSLEKGKTESATLVLRGLDPGTAYDFHFFGVRDAPVAFVSKYTVNGQSVTLAVNNNRTNLGTISGIKPNAQGEAVIDYTIADGPNAHLSVLEITWGGTLPTRVGEYATASRPPAPTPAPTPAPVPQPAQVATAPVRPPEPAPTPSPSTPPPILQKSRSSQAPGQGLLYVGVALLALGLGIAGFSSYRLFVRS